MIVDVALVFLVIVSSGLLIVAVNIFNGLVALKNQVQRSWANIEVILKQRFDEIPQLIKVVEQYSGYEHATLLALAEARTRYGSANDMQEKIDATKQISFALKGILALSESYPNLLSNQNFIQLQGRISALEDAIADRREGYNESVTNFNTRIEQIPDIFVAKALSYVNQPLLKYDEDLRSIPDVRMTALPFKKNA